MTYKLTSGWPQNIESGAFVNPESDPAYIAWLAEGNTPEPADQPTAKDTALAALATLDLQYPITQRNLRDFVVVATDAFKALGIDMTVSKGYKTAKAVEALAAPLREQAK